MHRLAYLGLLVLVFPVCTALGAPIPISIGTPASGEVLDAEEAQVFVFSADAGQVVFVQRLASSNTNKLNWRLKDPHGRVIGSNTSSLGHLGPWALMGGSYSVEVTSEGGGLGTFEFVVHDVQHGTTAVSLGDSVAGELVTPGQRQSYTFTASHGQKLFVDQGDSSNYYALN